MLRTTSLGKAYLGSGWAIHPLSGSLLKTSLESVGSFQCSSLPPRVTNALKYCDDPYLLTPSTAPNFALTAQSDLTDASLQIQNQFENIKKFRAFNFYAALLYASFPSICFQESKQAFASLNSLNEHVTKDTCLEKCLAVAKCSLSFKDNGVLFIGAHLPLQAMHAWIIEDGIQPDNIDRQWINFLPLMAITRSNKFF